MVTFKSRVTVKILDYYFLNPAARHYVNELAKILHLDPKNVYRKLLELEKAGLLKSEFLGRERYFFLDRKSPLLKPYRQIFMKTNGLEKRFGSILAGFPGVKEAYIYGSFARNQMDAASDIDILAVGSHSTLELAKALNRLQGEIGREINVVNMSEREFQHKKDQSNPFIKNVFKNLVIKIK